MARSLRIGFFLALPILAQAKVASAANLSMRFAGGDAEVTLAPGETAVIEIVWTMSAQNKTARNMGYLNNRFDVDSAANLEVLSSSSPLAGWDTSQSGPEGGALADFFASADGSSGPLVETNAAFESVVQEITIRNVDGTSGSAEVAFRVSGPLPDAITSTGGQWTLVAATPAAQEFDIGAGSPGYLDQNSASNPAAPLVIRFTQGTGGGGGGGEDPPPNANDNASVSANQNDNTPVIVEPNDNAAPNDDGTTPNDNDAEAPSDDGSAGGENDNDPAGDDPVDEQPPDVGSDDTNGDNTVNPPGRGGGGGVACGAGIVVLCPWMFTALALTRCMQRRRPNRRP